MSNYEKVTSQTIKKTITKSAERYSLCGFPFLGRFACHSSTVSGSQPRTERFSNPTSTSGAGSKPFAVYDLAVFRLMPTRCARSVKDKYFCGVLLLMIIFAFFV